jgi:proton-dependent oligopeptide transporter, POT family
MRSLVQAIALFTNAISAAIAEALNPLAGDPLLIWNYGVFAVLSFFGGVFFLWQFWGLDKEEDELNNLPEGKVIASKDIETAYDSDDNRPASVEIPEKH